MNIEQFIGEKVIYNKEGQQIYGEYKDKGLQLLLDLRAWGAIQNLHKKHPHGDIDYEAAASFQDELGEWIANAINQKLKLTK